MTTPVGIIGIPGCLELESVATIDWNAWPHSSESAARAFDDRRFVLAGSLLAGVCLASLLWAPPLRMAIAGIGAGVVFWSFALWTSLRQAMPAELPAR